MIGEPVDKVIDVMNSPAPSLGVSENEIWDIEGLTAVVTVIGKVEYV